jgi:hypothetical protein
VTQGATQRNAAHVGGAAGDHGPHYFDHAEFVCAGDTVLGGPGLLGYGHSARRRSIICVSRSAGITCRNADNGHGFFLARAQYRIF